MKLRVCTANEESFIMGSINSLTLYSDYIIAFYLNITKYQYQKILKNHNGYEIKGNYYFKNKEDAEKVLEELTSILIMQKLVE